MLISTKGRYALRFMIDLAEHEQDGYIRLKDIAARQQISEKYLEAIVKALGKQKMIVALRGKGGGYRLAKAADAYPVKTILECMEGSLTPVACLEKGSLPCERRQQCRTLSLWEGLDTVISDYLARFTLADLAKPVEMEARKS